VQSNPDGGDEGVCDQREPDDRDWAQQGAGDRGEQAAATERAGYPDADRDVGEQLERGAEAEAKRRDRVKLGCLPAKLAACDDQASGGPGQENRPIPGLVRDSPGRPAVRRVRGAGPATTTPARVR
jgi:hypothetical protein